MLPLLKVRLKFYKNCRYCCFVLIYFIFILFIFMFASMTKEQLINIPKKEYQKQFKSTFIDFFKLSNYSMINNYLRATSLMVNDVDTGLKLKNFINNTCHIEISLNNTDSPNQIFLDYNKESKSYKFTYFIRDNNYNTKIFPFQSDMLSNYDAQDLFNSTNIKNFTKLNQKNYEHINNYLYYNSILSRFIIQHATGTTPNKNLNISLGFNSYPPSRQISKSSLFTALMIYINIEFYYVSFFITSHLFEEKHQRLDLLLDGLGISRIQNFFNWILIYLIQNSLVFISTYISFSLILNFSHFLVLFYLFLYLITTFLLYYFIVLISLSKNTGMIIYNIITVFPFVIGYALQGKQMIPILKLILCITPILNLGVTFDILVKYHTLQDFPLSIISLRINGTSYLINIIILILESLLFIILIYLKKKSSEYGLTIFSYIRFYIKFREYKSYNLIDENQLINEENNENDNMLINHEELSEKNKLLKQENNYLKIENISKNYATLKAVNKFSGEFFKNEIFVLLGPNGAGKTTLIKMITDADIPNEGDIYLNGKSILKDKNYLHKNISVCYHENIFFNYLTVEEHLKFIMEVKGDQVNQEQIKELIESIGLTEKKKSLCQNLSGGQKKKFCIALSLIGNSKIVILDEPTSELDVIARRNLWKFLKNYKKDKIIFITTHSLEEAEYLGDRIGIMNNGNFICSGSSSFLKQKYESGFNLNLMVNEKIFTNKKKEELLIQIRIYEPYLEVKLLTKNQMTVIIQSNNKNINLILEMIENNKEVYGIEDYTISSTSLEDVFLKVNSFLYNKRKGNINANNENNINNKNIINNNENIIDNNNIIKNNEIIEIKMPEISMFPTFLSQLLTHLSRHFSGLWRLKSIHLLNYIYCISFLYLYLIIHITILNKKPVDEYKLDLIELLESNNIFINDEEYLKSSSIYKNSFNFKKINTQSNIEKFIEEIYKNAYLNIGKSGIQIEKKENEILIYNTEIPTVISSYIMANILLTTSSFLKNEYNINAQIFPEITYTQQNYIKLNEINSMLVLGFVASTSYTFYLMSFLSEKIREKLIGLKHLLYLNGANMLSYWISFLIYDFLRSFIFIILISLGLLLVSEAGLYIFVLLTMASFSCIFFTYFLSNFCRTGKSSQLLLLLIYITFSLIPAILGAFFDIDVNSTLINPNYSIFDILPMTSILKGCYSMTLSFFPGMVSADKYVLKSMLNQLINCIIYMILFILSENNIFKRILNYIKTKWIIKDSNVVFSEGLINEQFLNDNNLDIQDLGVNENQNINNLNLNLVEREKSKIMNDLSNNLPTKIVGLKKTYSLCCRKNVRAVNNVYFGLENGEKFGLLGFNGGGKSTIFKCITKEILYDSGQIFLSNKNINNKFDEIRNIIGYCPQENPIIHFLTVKELLTYFMDLKDIFIPVENIAKKFGLKEYLNTYCANLSAGNQRKLSFALALMFEPKILLLDEPSNCVDPVSRRIMWKNIIQLNKKYKDFNMILTTHSMEEAEILCDRISWLKSGNIVTIGNPEKLKLLLSIGYKLHIKFAKIDNNIIKYNNDEIIKILSSNIKGFDKFIQIISDNPQIIPYLAELLSLILNLKEYCSEIMIKNINNDFSFDFNIQVENENKNKLFAQIFKMKNENILLSQIDISTESLENILTKI